MKPIIAITSQYSDDNKMMMMRSRYFDYVTLCGGMPISLPQYDDLNDIKQIAEVFDGYLFSGGDDVNPNIYNEEKIDKCGFISDERDYFEIELVKALIENNKPIFGICRGIQVINAALGGTLYQHYDGHQGTRHDVMISKDSLLYEIYKKDKINVNSYHHQGIKQISDKLNIAAIDESGKIEAICKSDCGYLLAVQWHPEVFDDDKSLSLILMKDFISNCVKEQL